MSALQASVSHSKLLESSLYLPHFSSYLTLAKRWTRPPWPRFSLLLNHSTQASPAKGCSNHAIPTPSTGQWLPWESEQIQTPPTPAHLITSGASFHFHTQPCIVQLISINRLSPSPRFWPRPFNLLCSQCRSSSFYHHLHRELLNV